MTAKKNKLNVLFFPVNKEEDEDKIKARNPYFKYSGAENKPPIESIHRHNNREVYDMDPHIRDMFDSLKRENDDFKKEIRERDSRAEMRQVEMEKRVNANIKEVNESHKELIKKIDDNITISKETNRSIKQFNIATLIALVSILITMMFGLFQIFQATISLVG